MDLLDIYGIKPIFYFDKKEKVKTIPGVVLSFALAILIACSLWFFGKDMIYRETPTLVTSSFNLENPPPFSLTKDNFYLAVGVSDTYGAGFADETYFSIFPRLELISFDSAGNLKIEYKEVNIKRCSEVEFPILKESYSQLSLNNLYCIDQDEMVIQGEFGQEVFTTLRVECNKCTGRPDCKSNDEIVKRMKNGYFSTFMVDYSLDPTNYEKPLQPFLNNIFTILDPTVYKDFITYVSAKNIVSDTGIMFEDKSTINGYAVEKTVELQSSTPINSIITFYVRLSKTNYRYQRIYLKIQKVAANMGGIIKILIVLGRILIYPFTTTFYFERVSKWIFPERNDKIAVDPLKSSLSSNNFIKPSPTKILKKVALRREVTSAGIVSYFLCRRNKETKALFEMKKKYGDYIQSRFDLKTLVKYQNEFILFKKIFLSEHQNKLVTFFESPNNYSFTQEEAYNHNNDLNKVSEKTKKQIEGAIAACNSSNESKDKALLSILGLK